MDELKRKYEASMKDVLHILGEYDYQYIKEYVEHLESQISNKSENVENEKSSISAEDWKKAYGHAQTFLTLYEFTPYGAFGASLIRGLITRYDNGERTEELYLAMISIE